MYNGDKIIPGLVIFVGLITFPIWYSLASGKADYVPQPQIVTQEKQCVESTQYMRDNHMDLLNSWRQTVVREGNRTYVASDGKEYFISINDTCWKCHPNKAEFCDRCHDYTGTEPNCWDCHNTPKES